MSDNKFGFDFGSMTVTRTCQDKTASIIRIATKKCTFSVRATNNGSVRFFDDQGNECVLVQDAYIKQLEKGD